MLDILAQFQPHRIDDRGWVLDGIMNGNIDPPAFCRIMLELKHRPRFYAASPEQNYNTARWLLNAQPG